MLNFTIEINASLARRVEFYKLNVLTFTRNNMRPDTVTMKWTGRHREDCPIKYDDKVDLYRRGRRFFSGRCKLGPRDTSGVVITVENALAELDELPFFSSPTTGGYFAPELGSTFQTNETGQWFDGVVWRDFVNPITWTWSTVDSTDFANSKGTKNINNFLSSTHYLFPVIGGAATFAQHQFRALVILASRAPIKLVAEGQMQLTPLTLPRPQLVSGISIAEGMRRSLDLVPDASVWFDYSVKGPPTMNLERFLAPSLGLNAPVISASIQPLPHLVPSGVIVRRMAGGNPALFIPPYVQYSFAYPEGTQAAQRKALIVSVDENVGDSTVQVLAYGLYNALETLRAKGTVVLHDPLLSDDIRPGRTILIPDVLAAEGVQLCVQSTSWSAATGEVTCELGYPQHLGIEQALDLRAWAQRAYNGI